jgi:NADH-quinone oxidoreductase subunit N
MDFDFTPLQPAAVLTLGILGVILADLLSKGKRPWLPSALALAALVGAGVLALGLKTGSETVLGVLVVDKFAIVFTVFCCATGAISILATTRGEAFRVPGGEFLTLILSSVLGMSVLAMSTDLVTLYLAFETISIPSYVLVAMRRADPSGNEAGLKYVLFGAVSSAVMLYGLSVVVGLSGGTSLAAVAAAVEGGMAAQPMFLVACAMVFAGFAFKVSAVPFHFWAPDVYAGAPAAVGGFLSVASKAAGFAALVRVVSVTVTEAVPAASDPLGTFLPEGNVFLAIIAVSAVLTMTIGNLAALRQRSIKRLLAWSSIAHAGYLLLVLSVWSERAVAALLLYLVAYLFMNLAAFLIAGIVIRERGTDDVSALRGLGRQSVGLALAFAIVLFSLTGLPPFFGFVAKLQVFYAVFEQKYVWLGVIGLVNGVISLFYYARILASMYLDADTPEGVDAVESEKPMRLAWPDALLCAVLVLPILVFGLFWSDLWLWAQDVAHTLPLFVGGK